MNKDVFFLIVANVVGVLLLGIILTIRREKD